MKSCFCLAAFADLAPWRETGLSVHELSLEPSPWKLQDRIKKDQSHEGSESIDAAIDQRGGSTGNKTLVVFIHQGEQAGGDEGGEGAARIPSFRVAGLEGMIEEQAEYCVFGAVRELSNQEMNDGEGVRREVDVQRDKNLRQEPAGNGPAVGLRGKQRDGAWPGGCNQPNQKHARLEIERTSLWLRVSQASSWVLPW